MAVVLWSQRPRGFSLLEILIVLVIGVLLVALVPPLLSGMNSAAELRGAARQIAAGLRSARNAAITTQRAAVFTLDVAERRFRVSGETRIATLPEGITLQLNTVQSEQHDDHTGNIRFFPDGSATGGAITVIGAKQAYRVTVDWLTGAVAVRDAEKTP